MSEKISLDSSDFVYKCKIPILFQLVTFNLLIITEIWHYCNTIRLPHGNPCF